MGLRLSVLPLVGAEDGQARGEDLRIALARDVLVPLHAECSVKPEDFFDSARAGWHLRLRHPSFPERGDTPPEEQWHFCLEHAHRMDLGCRVPLSDFACEHGRRFRPERG